MRAKPEDDREHDRDVAGEDEAGRVKEAVRPVEGRGGRGELEGSHETQIPRGSGGQTQLPVSRTAASSTMGETWQTIGTGTEADRSADGRRARTSSSSACSLRAMGGCAGRIRSAAASSFWSHFCSRRSSRCSLRPLRSRAARSCSPPATSRTSVRWRSAQNSFLYTDNNRLLGVVPSATNRQPLPLSQISPMLPQATVAIEDARFWQHGALDYRGIARALYQDVAHGQVVQGGSTITQELVRNLYIGNPQRTLSRKIKEACLSDKLFQREQHKYGKNAGSGSSPTTSTRSSTGGMRTAPRLPRGRTSRRTPPNLTLVQAALLAGLPQAPTVYDPLTNPHAALVRRNEVLQAMWKNGYITRGEAPERDAEEAGAEARAPLLAAPASRTSSAGRRQQLANRFGMRAAGRARRLQGRRRRSTRVCRRLALHAASTVLHTLDRPGGRDRRDRPADRRSEGDGRLPPERSANAVQLRDAGAPLDRQRLQADHARDRAERGRLALLDLLRARRSSSSPTRSARRTTARGTCTTTPTRRPGRWTSSTRRRTRSTRSSRSSIAKAGVGNVVPMAHNLGITEPSGPKSLYFKPVCAITLGSVGLHAARAHRRLRDVRRRAASTTVRRRSRPSKAPSGKVIRKLTTKGDARAQPERQRQAHGRAARVSSQHGTGTAASLGARPVAGKTGTAENFQDAWFCGYVPQLATCVWVGYPKGEISLYNVEGVGEVVGGTLPAEIWHDFMSRPSPTCPSSSSRHRPISAPAR